VTIPESAPGPVPQIKVCGLTVVEEAVACARLGADAIGLIFYPPSPRHVTLDQARAIAAALPGRVPAVGVFVNPVWEDLVRFIEHCGLGGVQLHGTESNAFIGRLRSRYPITVLKGLFASKPPYLSDADQYEVSAFLVECGQGALPGGNAKTWDWGSARDFSLGHAMVLAGGLNPDNVVEAVHACLPDAVDASSGLESTPGRKDLQKVALFIDQVRHTGAAYQAAKKYPQPIFTKGV
jgi:phosphoribosylanthranilate isomerase